MLDNLANLSNDTNCNGIRSDGSSIKVMIVDDSLAVRRLLHRIFEATQYQIVGELDNGMDAIDQYEQLKPDIVTMDIVMPELEGNDAVTQIIKKDPDARIVMLSSLSQKDMVQECMEKGAAGYIIKPIVESEIPNILQNVKQIATTNK